MLKLVHLHIIFNYFFPFKSILDSLYHFPIWSKLSIRQLRYAYIFFIFEFFEQNTVKPTFLLRNSRFYRWRNFLTLEEIFIMICNPSSRTAVTLSDLQNASHFRHLTWHLQIKNIKFLFQWYILYTKAYKHLVFAVIMNFKVDFLSWLARLLIFFYFQWNRGPCGYKTTELD